MNSIENPLLLVGPQYRDADRPFTAGLTGVLEHFDPLGIAIVSAYLRKKGMSDMRLLPMAPEKMDQVKDAVSRSGVIFASARHYETSLVQLLIRQANQAHKPIIVGGYGPTFNPEAFEGATIVQGEFEPIAEKVLDDLLTGRLQHVYSSIGQKQLDLAQYVWPDRSIMPKNPYKIFTGFKTMSQEWSRGCPNGCTYCAANKMQGHKMRVRSIGDILAEAETYGLKQDDIIYDVDINTSAIPREHLRELFSEFKRRGWRFITEGTISVLLDDLREFGDDQSLLKSMSADGGKGGCYSFHYGADDISEEKVRGSADKEVKLLQQAAIEFRRFGIPLNVSVIVGLDHHKYPDIFFQIANTLSQVGAPIVFIHIATPYPRTPFGHTVQKADRIIEKDTTRYDHRHVVFEPKNMTAVQLRQGFYWLYRKLFSPEMIIRTAKRNLEKTTIHSDPFLTAMLSGVPWGVVNHLSLQELRARGHVDEKIQRELDDGFRGFV